MIRLFVPLLLIAFLLPTFTLGCNKNEIAENENNMMSKGTIPAIDAAAPANTETATFALG